MKHFNYIFTGSGLAALMTVYKMAQSGAFKDKTILLLDEKKTQMIVPGVSGTYKRELGTLISKKWDLALLPMLILNAI
jgi:lycopene beta-cyclase